MNFCNYLAAHAKQLPDKICLTEISYHTQLLKQITWKEFDEQVNNTAAYLYDQAGIRKGDVVAHFQNNSINWIVSYMAILKIGAIVMPLSFRFTDRELVHASLIAKPVVLIFEDTFGEVVERAKHEIPSIKYYICVGKNIPDYAIDFNTVLTYTQHHIETEPVGNDDALAMMFTSGTTGTPKAVIHTHGTMQAIAEGNTMSYGVVPNDTYLIMIPLFHSGSFFFWSSYYICGAAAVILKEFREAEWIFKTIATYKCSDVVFVVPIGLMVIQAIEHKKIAIADYDLSAWKRLIMGAQPVPHHIMEKFAELLPAEVIYSYGITEGGGAATIFCRGVDILKKQNSIGKPNHGVEAKLVDENGNSITQAHQVGELAIKTPRNMKAYFNNAALTQEVLKDNWLHTGDMATMDDDGYYYLVDRKKDIIVCGGENLFPAEIEAALARHVDVLDVAVIGFPDAKMIEIPLAIIQLKPEKQVSEHDIILFAKQHMAHYKVPRKIIFADVPRNATGKIMKPDLRQKYTGMKESITKLM